MDTSGNRTALGVSADVAQLVGSRIRQAREATGRSTSALSAKIKVREHYLVAIEDGHWNELPPGLNGRGLVRIYARELSVSVPELDQAANQSVMPAEHDAQAPYQVGQPREARTEREFGAQRVVSVPDAIPSRVPETPVKTSTLNAPSNQQRAQQESQPKVQTRLGRSTSVAAAHRELTPEEEPLDVTTPDVASILGISLDVIDDNNSNQNTPVHQQSTQSVRGAETLKRDVSASVTGTEEAVLPLGVDVSNEQSAHTHRSEMLVEPNHAHQKSTPDDKISHRKSAKKPQKHRETPSQPQASTSPSIETAPVAAKPTAAPVEPAPVAAEPTSAAVETAPVAAEPTAAPIETVAVAGEPTVASVDAASIASEPAIASSEATSVANDLGAVLNESDIVNADPADSVSVAETASGIAAAEAYLKSHEAEAVAVDNDIQKLGTVNSTKIRWAVGLLAACVTVLIVGRAILSEPQPMEQATVDQSSQSFEPPAPSQNETSVTEPEGTLATEQSLTEASVEPQPSVDVAATGPVEATQAPIIEAAQEQVDPSASTEVRETTQAEEDAGIEAGTAEQKSQIPVLQGAVAAQLELIEAVDIQLTIDGTRVFSGRHEAGAIELKFNKRAEIFVQDGSKAVLKYSGWSHGALGQAGRKRRIVLNADSFQ